MVSLGDESREPSSRTEQRWVRRNVERRDLQGDKII